MANDIRMRSSTEKFQRNQVRKSDIFFSSDNNEKITNLST